VIASSVLTNNIRLVNAVVFCDLFRGTAYSLTYWLASVAWACNYIFTGEV